MLQFYLISVSLNALAGYFLFFRSDGEVSESQTGFSLHNETVKLVVGILSALTGIVKLLSPIQGIAVIGDFLPAITGIFCGFILIYEFYKNRSTIDDDSEQPEKISGIILSNKKYIGAAALISAVLHFIFPRVPLL